VPIGVLAIMFLLGTAARLIYVELDR